MKFQLPRVALHPISRSTGEQRLCAALLSDALDIRNGQTPASADERQKALAWIARRSDAVASFDWCCRALGIEPSAAHASIDRTASPGFWVTQRRGARAPS
jgi:hypothetical protein